MTDQDTALAPAAWIDSDHPAIVARARALGRGSARETAIAIYDAVRDGIRYDPYVDFLDPETYRASSVLAAGRGYCVGKASLFAALCRANGIPARLGLADVVNHLVTPRLREAMGTDLFAYHGFAEILLDGRSVKVSPTFNEALCQILNVAPLAFDGAQDALLQAHDARGRVFMEYVADHGRFDDVPFAMLVSEMQRIYPRLCVPGGLRGPAMEAEAKRS